MVNVFKDDSLDRVIASVNSMEILTKAKGLAAVKPE